MTYAAPLSGIPTISTMVGGLFIVCIIAYFSLRLLYGKGALRNLGTSRQLIRILDRRQIAQNRTLLVIEIGGKVHFIGSTDQAFTYLSPVDAEALPKEPEWNGQENPVPLNSYLNALSRRWKRNRKGPPDA